MIARAMTDDRERCLKAGRDGCLSTPIDPARLFAVVEQQTAGFKVIATQNETR
jgi:CheY-like chemotaxis protein